MAYVIFGIMAVVAVISILQSKKRYERARAAWDAAAHKLGLACAPGKGFSAPSIRGRVGGFAVHVAQHTRGSGKNRSTWTRYRVQFPDLGLGLHIRREVPILGSIARALGGQDVEVGAKAFDDRLTVKGRKPAQVREFLSAARQRAVLQLFSQFSHGAVDDDSASGETRGLETDAARVEANIRAMLQLARTLVGVKAVDRAPATGPLEFPGFVASDVDTRRSPPPEAATDPAPEPVSEPAPLPVPTSPRTDPAPPPSGVPAPTEASPAESPRPGSSRQADVCRTLFSGESMLNDARRTFDEEFAGLFVHWTGTLRSVRHAYSSLEFEGGEHARAEVEIGRVSAGVFGDREVRAVLQLPASARQALDGRDGSEVTFEGDLVRIDPFMRHVFVANATVVDE